MYNYIYLCVHVPSISDFALGPALRAAGEGSRRAAGAGAAMELAGSSPRRECTGSGRFGFGRGSARASLLGARRRRAQGPAWLPGREAARPSAWARALAAVLATRWGRARRSSRKRERKQRGERDERRENRGEGEEHRGWRRRLGELSRRARGGI